MLRSPQRNVGTRLNRLGQNQEPDPGINPVAIYHFSVKVVSRSDGKSVVAAAAYRSGTRLREHRTGIVSDFGQKRGVQHTEILAPENAPAWMSDRAALWNAVEEVEKRRDAQLARDLEIALPTEMNDEGQIELLRDFVRREETIIATKVFFSDEHDPEQSGTVRHADPHLHRPEPQAPRHRLR